MMKDWLVKLKHILYRLKLSLLSKSAPARWVAKQIWRVPSPGVVNVIQREEQDINHYFNWNDLQGVAGEKLREFTERYASEPNIVYSIKGNLVIEPEFGLVINSGREFVRESGTLSHIYLKPSLTAYLKHRWFRRKYTHYDKLIHVDGFAGRNLCHFIYDVVNPVLFMLERRMITESDPLLVGERVYSKSFFQYYLKHTPLGKLNWVRQKDNEWIRVGEITKTFVSMEIFKSTYKLLKNTGTPHRKIFLDRRAIYQRNIRNISAVQAILSSYGFETIFAEDLSYEDQVNLFRSVKHFVGIHGAGLTNLIHAKIDSLRVLEIFSSSMVNASFYRFLKILGVGHYDALAGSELDINWSFTIDEKAFEEKVKLLLQR